MPQLGTFQLGEAQLGGEGRVKETTEWRVIRNQDIVEDSLFDVEVSDTANPFGNKGIAYIDDSGGTKFEDYARGTRVDFEVKSDSASAFEPRFTGYVVERRELDRAGSDSLEVEAYSFDQFLRHNTIAEDLSGKTLESALQTIIQNYTPIAWNATNVTVGDPQTLTQSYRGDKVENAIQSLAGKSVNEEFGVNSNVEFFFRPREEQKAPRDIDNTQWFNYDIPERGKGSVNEVTVWYNGGTESVTLDDGGDKLDLQDSLNTARPVSMTEEVNREEITDIDDARAVAEQILGEREPTLTGTVTTYGLLDAEPGDVINIEIVPRGINGDFRIAELAHHWGPDETEATIVEKRGNQDEMLVRMSDTLKRTEMRSADRDAIGNVVTSTSVESIVTPTGDVNGTSFSSAKVTNTARDKIGVGWGGDGNISIADIAVGNDATQPSRTDTALGNELERVAVTESLPTAKSVEYSGSFSATDIREVGLFDSSGDLICRGVIPETSLTTPSATVNLTVSNDASIDRGVITNAGQTVVRDIVADNSPNVPTQYAYGSGDSPPTESDTALEVQETSTGIDQITVQDADTDTEWGNITSLSSTDNPTISAGELKAQQSAFHQDARDASGTYSTGSASEGGSTDYVDGFAAFLDSSGAFIEYSATTPYDIPEADVGLAVRQGADDTPGISYKINGNEVDYLSASTSTINFGWHDVGDGALNGTGWANGTLPAGTHTIRMEVTGFNTGENMAIDWAVLYDKRFTYNFDNNTDANNELAGPELYPDVVQVPFDVASTRRTLKNATATQTWNDISNNQFIEMSNDGGATWHRTNNSQTASATFASEETDVQARVGLSRFGSQTETPTSGVSGQAIDTHNLEADVDAIIPKTVGVVDVQGIVEPGVLAGTTIRESGQLASDNTLLSRSTFADMSIKANQRVISSESVGFSNPE